MAGAATAAQRVLALPELLEQILQDLPPCQLFIIQRTNSTFQAVVEQSKAMRRPMCLELGSQATRVDQQSWLKSLLEHLSMPLGSIPTAPFTVWTRARYVKQGSGPKGSKSRAVIAVEVQSEFGNKRWTQDTDIFEKERCQEVGSWKDLLFGLPGSEMNLMVIWWESRSHGAARSRTIIRKTKEIITVGEVLEQAKVIMREHLADSDERRLFFGTSA